MTRTWDGATVDGTSATQDGDRGTTPDRTTLVIVWSKRGGRLGESLAMPLRLDMPVVVGRGDDAVPGAQRARWVKRRPGDNHVAGPLTDRTLSRAQLLIRRAAAGNLAIENVGRAQLYVNGAAANEATVRPGDLLMLGSRLMFLVMQWPVVFAEATAWQGGRKAPAFGHPDNTGLVGESPAAWQLRDQTAFVARRPHHVLVAGPSGVGKELVARAIHQMSPRSGAPMVARNAATIPSGLADAEIFGHTKNYPNSGMPERPGLIGRADGGSLLLDELGELPEELQAHLLRVLDSGGEYQRLGDSEVRRADFRLIGATNRDPSELRHDLVPRLTLRVRVPGLNERRTDIPLLIRHLLQRAVDSDDEIRARIGLTDGRTGQVSAHPSAELVAALIQHPYTHHVRELEALLWRAIAETPTGGRVGLSPAIRAELEAKAPAPRREPSELTKAQIAACLEKHDGVQARVWRELGLKNRFVLRRLIEKHGLEVTKAS